MTTAISTRIDSLKVGAVQESRTLKVLPILGPSQAEPAYRLIDTSTHESVRVTEVSHGGTVPELQVENTLLVPVFLMDGQELVGAKQNRILNTDVLVPPQKRLKIPVSCVEAGRWHYTTEGFSPGKAASYTVRARKHTRVDEALRETGRHDADQQAVWSDVQESMALCQAVSPTAALHDAYEQSAVELDKFREELVLPTEAVGLAVLHGASVLGLDVFDRHQTLAYYWRSLIDSYALDWLRAPRTEINVSAEELVRSVLISAKAATWASFASPGLGTDLRFVNNRTSGSALVWDESTVVHMTLFPKAEQVPHLSSQHAERPRIRRRFPRSGS